MTKLLLVQEELLALEKEEHPYTALVSLQELHYLLSMLTLYFKHLSYESDLTGNYLYVYPEHTPITYAFKLVEFSKAFSYRIEENGLRVCLYDSPVILSDALTLIHTDLKAVHQGRTHRLFRAKEFLWETQFGVTAT